MPSRAATGGRPRCKLLRRPAEADKVQGITECGVRRTWRSLPLSAMCNYGYRMLALIVMAHLPLEFLSIAHGQPAMQYRDASHLPAFPAAMGNEAAPRADDVCGGVRQRSQPMHAPPPSGMGRPG